MGPAHSAKTDDRNKGYNNNTMTSERTASENLEYFPLTELPDYLLGEVLARLPAEDIVRSCVFVCNKWRDVLNSQTLWKKKCKNDYYYTDEMLCDVKDFKQHYFKNPYNSNLVKNSFAEEGFSHWKITKNGGDGFICEKEPTGSHPVKNFAHCSIEGPIGCWVTSFGECKKEQEIDLIGRGCSPKVLDNVRPDIQVSEWYAARFDCGCKYKIKIDLLDADRKVLDCFNFMDEKGPGRDWFHFTHVFTSYPPGCRYIRYIHGGHDEKWWAGHYGVKITLSSLRFDFTHIAGPYVGEFKLPEQQPCDSSDDDSDGFGFDVEDYDDDYHYDSSNDDDGNNDSGNDHN